MHEVQHTKRYVKRKAVKWEIFGHNDEMAKIKLK